MKQARHTPSTPPPVLILRLSENQRPIALVTARSTSDTDIADYEIEATTYGSSLAGTVDKSRRLRITGHDRRRSPWWLVKRIAEMLRISLITAKQLASILPVNAHLRIRNLSPCQRRGTDRTHRRPTIASAAILSHRWLG